ncbi:arsenate reductase/protein-tyrosine-phosphatase family protein [Pseudonocardia oceani]|uniref:Phosphotyrosine protein phosphatase I domain-containing protein n=4 Tax=Pseudonocardia oceani TaxID=2792013 RepID=A0ABS6U5I6_9PSEU|nr:hypothetical protein [Pseudonocardia oceani]MBW0127497.1 hypothetical protein [Pseudonocardia oceani]
MNRHQAPDGPDSVFRLLFVCTGNICRSPFAEILTRHLLIGRLGGREAATIEVSSAGVSAVPHGRMHDDTRDELSPWGLDRQVAGRFVARQLRSPMIDQADLILGATPRHRSAVVERNPAGLAKTFGLREFARLARAVDVSALPEQPGPRARALVELARRQRGLLPPVEPEDDRIPDPMGGTVEDHHHATVLIREAVSLLVDVVAPPRPAIGPVRRPAAPPPRAPLSPRRPLPPQAAPRWLPPAGSAPRQSG